MNRRLLPLYLSAFFQGLPLWYAIEKLFMTSIGFSTASIGVMVAIMSLVMLAVETPSGVLADRWSRKGVMALGCGALFISSLIGGLSYDEPIYILSAVFWGIYAALYSGTYDSVIYDVTFEEQGGSDKYAHNLGRLRVVEGAALVIGAIGGGLIASRIGMRETYFLSLPFIALGALLLIRFREPTLHKAEIAESIFRHIRQTFSAVLTRRILLPVVLATVGFAVLQETIFELGQLWFIAIDAPLALYGLISAVVFSTWTVGGLLAARFSSGKLSVVGLVVIIISILSLIISRNYWVLLATQFLLSTSLVGLGVVLSKKLHDELPSKLRAGSSSVVSTLGRTILIPFSLLFTYVANGSSVFAASKILFAVALVASFAYLIILRTSPKIKSI